MNDILDDGSMIGILEKLLVNQIFPFENSWTEFRENFGFEFP